MQRGLVLVVEDNPITRKMLRFALESEGYAVLEAGDGETALKLAGRQQPDLVLQDYVLPDMDGIQLMRGLRRLPGASDVPVLMVTGMVSQLEELRRQSGPNTSILPKPIEPSRLLEVVRASLLGGATKEAGGRRVLVVDDDLLNRKLATLVLGNAGFRVETAASGEEALRKARQSVPDVILCDVLMPGMDGFLLTRAIRQDPLLAGVPIVLQSSAYVEASDQELAREVGAAALVPRSSDLQAAIEALREAASTGHVPGTTGRDVVAMHAERVQAQLEKQVARNEALLRQGAIQAAALSVVRGLAEALARPRDLTSVLGDVLVHCLDAAGLSTGLLYLPDDRGGFRLAAQAGLQAEVRPAAAHCFGRADMLQRALAVNEPVSYRLAAEDLEPGLREVGLRLNKAFGLVIPFVGAHEGLGILVLADDSHDLTEPAWRGFAQALALQFGQTIALGRSLFHGAVSEARYHTLMEGANDAILLLDPDFRILEANRKAEQLFGRHREEIVGRRYEDFVAPEDREQAAQWRTTLLSRGSLAVEERRLLWADGTRIAVEVSGSLVQAGDSPVVLAILRDVTARQQAAIALQESEAKYRSLVENVPDVVWSEDSQGRATFVSPTVTKLLGFTPEEVYASGAHFWLRRIHPDDAAPVEKAWQSLLTAGSPYDMEYRIQRKDGEWIWLHDRATSTYERDGIRRVDGIFSNVTKRREAEMRLKDREEHYRLLFQSNPHPMCVYDPEGLAFLEVNDAAVRLYGYSREEFLGMTIADIWRSDDVPARIAGLRSERPGGVSSDGIWRHRKKDGTHVDVEIMSNSIDFVGKGARLALAVDITEKRRLEAQLLQAQKMEAVGQLAGGVAHDFNNLLGVITGYSDLLRSDLAPGARGPARLEQIRAATERAALLTRQLLAFSRQQVLKPQVLGLRELVANLEGMLRRVIEESIELVITLEGGAGRVKADPGQIEQVVMNLAVNARDAMPRGGRLTVEVKNVRLEASSQTGASIPAGDYVLLAVSDTGTGMDKETQGRMFEPFFTTKEQGKGTGLGLATVHGIVKQSGGFIWTQSEVGLGTTFRVYLPRVDEPLFRAEDSVPAVTMPSRGETVLLCEDEAALRALIREELELLGYRVLEASSGEEALVVSGAHSGPIHLLLTDVVMPGMSGPILAARLVERRPGVRVLFASGYLDAAITHEGLLRPGAPMIQKPFSIDELGVRVREVLDQPTD